MDSKVIEIYQYQGIIDFRRECPLSSSNLTMPAILRVVTHLGGAPVIKTIISIFSIFHS